MPASVRTIALTVACATALPACGEFIRVKNLAPEVAVVGLCTAGERVYVEFTVQDLEQNDVTLDLRLPDGAADPVDERALVIGPRADGVAGLRADRDFPGKHHWAEWAACGDPLAEPVTKSTGGDGCAAVAPETDGPPAYVGAPTTLDGVKLDVIATDTHDKQSVVRSAEAPDLGECDFAAGAHE